MAEKETFAAVSMQARSLDIPTESHPNKMPFSGVLTRIGEPSDAAPDGSGGRRVMITMEAAHKALDSLLGMGIDFQPEFDGHDPKAKIGVITGAEIEANALKINGFIYAADFPKVAQEIKANKHALGMSFEARDLMTTDPKADPIPIFDCVFTGAAILLKDKAAYRSTSISAKAENDISIEKGISMTTEELKKHLDEMAASFQNALKPVADAVKAQAEKIAELEKAPEKIFAANHLNMVEPHAKRLEDAADKMDSSGIGGHSTRGHAVMLRDMAGSMRAEAAQGKLPHIYVPTGGMWASAETGLAKVEDEVKKAVSAATAEFEKKFGEMKAAAESAEKGLKDQLASAETKLKDMQAAAEKKAADAPAAAGGARPERKTLTSANMTLLAKSGIALPKDGEAKLDPNTISEVLAKAGVSVEKRFQVKTDLAAIGALA